MSSPVFSLTCSQLFSTKVGSTSIRHADRNDTPTYYSRCPTLNLKGQWLEEAGFATGQPVKVSDTGLTGASRTRCHSSLSRGDGWKHWALRPGRRPR
ncbi:hypothetical protein CKF42_20230 [Pantoea sp. ARC270]|nr:type I toxin-antitoxin system SymE family toxin [Pantoea sp. EKM101V]PZL84823.1 hypothetical protein CKF42_20230 [Pantoea sp. ARC270]